MDGLETVAISNGRF